MSYNYDLGTHHRPITTNNIEAQQWFDRGLIWIYGFDLEMAGRCFQQAIDLDDNCAMAWWGSPTRRAFTTTSPGIACKRMSCHKNSN